MILESYVVGMLQTNCYLLGDEGTGEAVVIDPGGEAGMIAGRIQALGLQLVAILNTHGHFDHVMDAWVLKEKQGGEIYMHLLDLPIVEQSMRTMGAFFGLKQLSHPIIIDHDIRHGSLLEFGPMAFSVLETPGHTPGHVCFVLNEGRHVFVGDTLFAGSIGRTDLPGGSYDQLIRSVREQLFALDEQAIVYPGHGPRTTVGRERRTNPFFR